LLESWPSHQIPKWASLRRRRFQYTEYYDAGEIDFREYYRLTLDPWQMTNVLNDGHPGNDPSRARIRSLHRRLSRLRRCAVQSCP
jgi:hypothetical protein